MRQAGGLNVEAHCTLAPWSNQLGPPLCTPAEPSRFKGPYESAKGSETSQPVSGTPLGGSANMKCAEATRNYEFRKGWLLRR